MSSGRREGRAAGPGQLDLREQAEGTPKLVLMMGTAGGFYFYGDKAPLDGRVFCVDGEAVCQRMTKVYKKEKFVAGVPGQTFVMQSGKHKAIEPGTAFLAAAPRDPWPSRGQDAAGEPRDYTPATGRRELDADERARLGATLTELAGSPVGGPRFKGLFSLTSERAERTPTFASVARSGEDRHLFAYVATRCAFAPAHTDGTNPRTAYLAGAGVLGRRSARCARRRAWPDRLDLRPRPAVERVAAAFCVSTSSGSSTG